MITISGKAVSAEIIETHYTINELERVIVNKLSQSSDNFNYNSIKQLKFELDLRINIIAAAKELNRSNFEFAVFKEAYCNADFWDLTKIGGFKLKQDIKPADAIKDIFINSSKYGTECATAIVIVFYKALVNIYPDELFNYLFSGIYLMDWSYLDEDLGISSYAGIKDFVPGDCLYFSNPEVNPETDEWQGENVIDLGNESYYGHGIGIESAEKMISELNKNRKKEAKKSAFLTKSVTRPNFKYLANRYLEYMSSKIRANMYREAAYCCRYEINMCPLLSDYFAYTSPVL